MKSKMLKNFGYLKWNAPHVKYKELPPRKKKSIDDLAATPAGLPRSIT